MTTYTQAWNEIWGEAYYELIILPKKNARSLLNYHLRKGHIQREPCEVCGAKKVEAHHPDYEQPMVHVWLCRPCHRELHQAIAAAAVSVW